MTSLLDVQRGYDRWAAKPHNAKWVRKIDGTPIANDIVVNIFDELKDIEPPVPAELSVGSKPVAWTTRGNLETLASTPKEARYMWGLPSGSTISVPLYASPQAPAELVVGSTRIVPINPTFAMAVAGRDAMTDLNGDEDLSSEDAKVCYRAMIGATPLIQPAEQVADGNKNQPVQMIQDIWDEVGTALTLLAGSDVSAKARTLIREALESATGCKAPQNLGGSATPSNPGEAQC